MKKILLISFVALGFTSAPSFALDCNIQCTKASCAESQEKWNDCFKRCWRSEEGHITNCKASAQQANHVSHDQKMIMDYWNN